jgi:hypothetical protein
MHRSGSEECSSSLQESEDESEDEDALDKCEGVTSRWQPWYNSAVPKQVSVWVCACVDGCLRLC